MYDLTGRVALVTGAGPNIGRAIATTLARAGATVLCNDLKPEIAEAAAKAASQGNGKAHPLPFDITDPDAVENAVDEASRQHDVIDILVNNAGVTVPRSILTMSVEEWRLVTRVIQDGAFHCSRSVAKRLVAAKKPGAIVNIASTTGHRGRKNAIAYATAKGGILNFTRALAMDLAPHRIRVNSVSPTKTGASVGAIESAGGAQLRRDPARPPRRAAGPRQRGAVSRVGRRRLHHRHRPARRRRHARDLGHALAGRDLAGPRA